MEPSEANQELINQLLGRKSDLKLPHDVNFVFELSDGKRTEMPAEKLIAAVDNEQFAELFDKLINPDSTPEIRIATVKPEEFIDLLR